MKVDKQNKDFIEKLAFVLNEPNSDVLNYLIRLGKQQHIKGSMKHIKR